jgi:hypothetical protein
MGLFLISYPNNKNNKIKSEIFYLTNTNVVFFSDNQRFLLISRPFQIDLNLVFFVVQILLCRHLYLSKLIGRFWPNAQVHLVKWRPENLATLLKCVSETKTIFSWWE